MVISMLKLESNELHEPSFLSKRRTKEAEKKQKLNIAFNLANVS